MSQATSTALYEKAYQKIREKIIEGSLIPGSRIAEVDFSDRYRISRTPLREALFKLENEGFVISEKNRGFTVKQLSAREAREIYPILWNLEALALEQAAPLVFNHIAELQQLNNKFRNAAGHTKQALNADCSWHRQLICNCPNQTLLGIIESLRARIVRYERLFMSQKIQTLNSVKQHQQIIKSLEAKDISAAKKLLVLNWESGLEILLLTLGEP